MRILLVILVSLLAFSQIALAGAIDSSLTSKLQEGKLETYYAILGVSIDAEQPQIKANYRKLARMHHPDRASTEEKADKQQLFVKLSEAYQILSDDVLRARYDYLLSEGITVYENRDWSTFDKKRGLNRKFTVRVDSEGKEQFVFKDVYQQYQEEAEERALLVSFGVSGFIALIPIILYHYRKRESKQIIEQEMKQEKDQFIIDHERKITSLKAQREEEERLKQEHKAAQRLMNQQRKELLAKLAEEESQSSPAADEAIGAGDAEDEDEDAEESGVGVEREVSVSGNKGKSRENSSLFKCDVCRKTYKSEKQYEQHCSSKDHIKKMKAAKK